MTQQSTINQPPRVTGAGAHKDVQIISDDGQVDPVDVDIYRGQEAIWFAYNNQAAATIEFSPADCPFYQSVFQVPAGGTVSSGLFRSDAQSKRYKYTVKGSAGQNDPGVIIHN